jgi:hypothetical protein
MLLYEHTWQDRVKMIRLPHVPHTSQISTTGHIPRYELIAPAR